MYYECIVFKRISVCNLLNINYLSEQGLCDRHIYTFITYFPAHFITRRVRYVLCIE